MLGRPFQKARRAYCSLKWFVLSSVIWLSSVSLFYPQPHLMPLSSLSPLEAASIHTTKHPKRIILLGIFSQVGDTRERQLRHVIRNTYLAFDNHYHSNYNSNNSNTSSSTEPLNYRRVCSLDDFQKRKEDHGGGCQLVYVFVFFGGIHSKGTLLHNHSHNSSIAMDKTLFKNHEQDVVYLRIPERSSPFEKVRAWYQYVNEQQQQQQQQIFSNKDAFDFDFDFDFIVYTDTRTSILPTLFGQNELFLEEQHPPQQHVYGGLRMQKSECQGPGVASKACRTLLQGDFIMRHFVMVSADLVPYIATHIRYLPPGEDQSSSSAAWSDIAIANLLHAHPLPIQAITLQGISQTTVDDDDDDNPISHSSQFVAHDFLTRWDHYQDSVTDYHDPTEVQLVHNSPSRATVGTGTAPRLLLGIFTMDSAAEATRRAVIRRTWVQYYDDTTRMPKRICSLHELLIHTNNNNTTTGTETECQLAYVFVVGGNATTGGPTERLSDDSNSNASDPSMTVPCQFQHNSNGEVERDVVCLNIQENMNEGKSQTWFHYAASVVVLQHHYFDYIGKMDSDTLPFPNRLLNHMEKLPRFPHNMRVYGGNFQIKPSVPALHVGPAYMGGAFYWMSPDLARYISSPQCHRTALNRLQEDKAIGNFVHSHPLPIRRIRLPLNVREHPLKQVDAFQRRWEQFQRHKEPNEPPPSS